MNEDKLVALVMFWAVFATAGAVLATGILMTTKTPLGWALILVSPLMLIAVRQIWLVYRDA